MNRPTPSRPSRLDRLSRHFALPDAEAGTTPPSAPAPVPVDWPAVESWLGVALPSDYKELVTGYGPLDIGEYVWVHAPCVQQGRFDYGDWLRDTHRQTRINSRGATPEGPPPFHPAPGGLLAWGETRGSAVLFWDTSASDDPDEWPVVLFDWDPFPSSDPDATSGTRPWYPLGRTATETLTALLTTGIPMDGGGQFGPLPGTARRTAFLPDAAAWTPPPAAPAHDPTRRAALREGSGLTALTTLVPPPPQPYLGAAAADGWEPLFAELGTRLPHEYVTLLETYGAGCWSEWLRFHTPLRRAEGTAQSQAGGGFVWHAQQVNDAYRSLRGNWAEEYRLAVWPEPGGFLPFANSIDGDVLGWLTENADPDRWPLLVWPRHAKQGPPLEGSLTEVLLAWLRGRFAAPGFAELDEDDDPLDFIGFEPWSDRAYW
ncbi:SMI1/KNR4 family protein [Streptomyces sp. 8N114]|uniref:SMI1/KNR4 family protein n=1 Tax=Streptomyces sp. 8N114 TaxID=3457419 RepID=UPI003FD18B22